MTSAPLTPPPGCTDRCRLSPSFPARCKCECKGTFHGRDCPEDERQRPQVRRRATDTHLRRRQVAMSWGRVPARLPPVEAQLDLFDVSDCAVQPDTSAQGDR